MANATIKISQLPNIGVNLNSNTLLPVVSTNGTYLTDKVTVGNLANFVLSEAGNLLSEAFVSTIAYSVANSAQPNITSLGTLANLTVSSVNTIHIPGGDNGYYLQTDGTGNLAWVAGGGSGNGEVGGSNAQVQFNNEGSFGGDAGFVYDKDSNTLSVGNLNITANASADYITLTHDVTANVIDANYLYGDGSNITNLPVGNIAYINLNGNTSQFLRGDGTWQIGGGASTGNITFTETTITANISQDILLVSNPNSNVFIGSNNFASLIWEQDAGNISFDSDEGTFVWVESDGAHIWTHDTLGNTNAEWHFDNNGGLTSPVASNTQVYTKGTVSTIQGNPNPAQANARTSSQIYVASNDDVIALEMTLRVQSTNFVEIVNFNAVKESDNGNLYYSVTSRLKSNDEIADTIVEVDLDGSNNFIVLANCQTTYNVYYTYDVKEYRMTT